MRRFRIAFSFAGEKRQFVEQMADLLAEHFSKAEILYDRYHRAEFSRSDLAFYLPDLYEQEADLVVAVFCPDYEIKEWCGLEWNAIYCLLKARKVGEVMLTRFDKVEGKGLRGLAGYTDLDDISPAETADLILERLALNADKPADYYVSGRHKTKPIKLQAAIPNNLPRLQYFFGRDGELQKIAESLAEDARGWGALIDGPGGIGKTALAVRAAEFVPAGRFERIVFLSAKERELTADGQRALGHFVLPGYLEMLNAIARELAQPELTKLADLERTEAILRVLRDLNVLLVLDNLETLPEIDRDQLFAFLNRLPRSCSALVTSRRRADASAVTVRLDKLDWPAAEQLLAEIARDNRLLNEASSAERRSLYDETGGNPLLMRWLAGQLGMGRYKTVAAALAFLRAAPASNNPLEFVFGDLLDSFSEAETQVLAALAHFTRPMTIKIIAELAEINELGAEHALSGLAVRALVVPDTEERRFVLVPLVADFLRRRRPEMVAAAGGRLEQRAYALIVENGYDNHDRFEKLDAEWPSLAPAFPILLAGPNERLQTACDALRNFLNFTGRYDEWLALCQDAETKALAVEDFWSAGWRTYEAGFVYYLRGQAESVLVSAERAERHWQEAEQAGQWITREKAAAIRLKGSGYELREDYPSAIEAFRRALELLRSLDSESDDVAMVLSDLADAEIASGDWDAAERNYREALRIAKKVGYREGVAYVTCNLATLSLDRKDWSTAEQLAREAFALSEALGRRELIAENHRSIARALIQQGKTEQALPYAEKAVEIYTPLGSKDLKHALETLAECRQPASEG
ncbi:tetratricopeptide repeat protein [Methylococcaceae bacterium WWC4]|nr:tetratricopeptide repeat protein [Methylococcaceae bacterium WWC4]